MDRRFFRLLDGPRQHLREHPRRGNRSFFSDQLVIAHLLAFPNPILAGLRKIEDIFDIPAVRKWLKTPELLQGMTMQIYIALIGTLLIAIETGEKPSSYDFALMSMAVAGLAPMDQILAQAAKRRAERKRAAEQRRAKKIAG